MQFPGYKSYYTVSMHTFWDTGPVISLYPGADHWIQVLLYSIYLFPGYNDPGQIL